MFRPALLFCFLGLSVQLCAPPAAPAQAVAEASSKTADATDRPEEKKATPRVIPVFSFDQPLLEAPVAEDPLLGPRGAESLQNLLARLQAAQEDDQVPAVVLLWNADTLGTGQLEEVAKAIRAIRDAGKPVYAHADSLSFRGLTLLSQASHVTISPVGDLFINGLFGSQLCVRGMLDKIHVTPDFITCGEYKSASELFMRKQPSPAAQEMYDWLFDSLFESHLRMVAEGRKQPIEKVREWVDDGIFSAESATTAGIIDGVAYRDDLPDLIRQHHGDAVKFARKYQQEKESSVDLASPMALFQILAEMMKGAEPSKDKDPAVAIVYVEGPIMPGRPEPSPFAVTQTGAYSEPLRQALHEAAEDDAIKAVVLRVNSPGGSAVASEIILQATRHVADKKPLVVSMGDVAGSGGYYVACGANTIFANATTITASIGVVAGKLATNQMWEAVGVNWHPIARGKNAGMLASGEVFTPEQKENLQHWMNEVYAVFQGHVVDIRGDRLKKPIEQLAGGRVFTGQQALELGLVDRIGTLRDAIAFAADEAGLEDPKIRVLPRPRNFFESIMGDALEKEDSKHLGSAATSPADLATSIRQLALPALRQLQPHRAAALQRALMQLEILQKEGLSLLAPEFLIE